MMKPLMQTPWIALSARVYRVLLVFYPADYRREYGALMVQVFRDVSRDTYRSEGWAGIAFWWCATLLDLTLTVIEQRRKVRFVMSKSMFVQLTGIFLIVGGLCGMIAAFSQLQPGSHYTYYGVYQIAILLLCPAYLLIGLGNFGLALRHSETAGVVPRLVLIVMMMGALLMATGIVLTQIQDSFWNIWMIGLLIHTIGTLIFGLVHLRTPILPVWRGLPLLIGLLPLPMVFGIFRTSADNGADLGGFIYLIGFAAWIGVGFAVRKHQSRPEMATA
jgi:hypothetical protein